MKKTWAMIQESKQRIARKIRAKGYAYKSAEQLEKLAIEAMQREDWQSGARLWKELINKSCDTTTLYYINCSRCLCNSARFDEAEEVVISYLLSKKNSKKVRSEYVDILIRQRKWSSAIDRAKEQFPSGFVGLKKGFYVRLSKCCLREERHGEADEILLEGLQYYPGDISLLTERSRQLYKRLRWEWSTYQFWSHEFSNFESHDVCRNNAVKVGEMLIATQNSILQLSNNTIPQGSVKEFVLSRLLFSSLIGENRQKSSFQPVKNVLYTLCEENERIAGSVTKLLEGDINSERATEEFVSHLDATELTYEALMGVYDILLWHGFFRSGFYVREQAVKKACEEDEMSTVSALKGKVRALIEAEEFMGAKEALETESHGHNQSSLLSLELYCACCLGDRNYFNANKQNLRDGVDGEFYKLIKGKSVAVVGPAPTGEMNGEEIDSYDVVVRFSYTGMDLGLNSNEFGRRVDVSYYGSTFLKRYFKNIKYSAIPALKFAVYKKFPESECADGASGVFRSMIPFDEMFHKGRTAMPAALYDILHYEPSRLKLFHATFYLSKNIYANGHAGRLNNEDVFSDRLKAVRSVMYQHDHLSQLIFVRNLRDAGWIEVDQACGSILNFSNEEYMSEMEKSVFDKN